MNKKLFKCLFCTETFSTADVREGLYFPSTGICLECYWNLSRGATCFGKKSRFDLTTNECGHECPDRKICRVFVEYRKVKAA